MSGTTRFLDLTNLDDAESKNKTPRNTIPRIQPTIHTRTYNNSASLRSQPFFPGGADEPLQLASSSTSLIHFGALRTLLWRRSPAPFRSQPTTRKFHDSLPVPFTTTRNLALLTSRRFAAQQAHMQRKLTLRTTELFGALISLPRQKGQIVSRAVAWQAPRFRSLSAKLSSYVFAWSLPPGQAATRRHSPTQPRP